MFSPIATMDSLLLMRNRSIQQGNLIPHVVDSMFGRFSQPISLKIAWLLSHMLNACFHVLQRSLMQCAECVTAIVITRGVRGGTLI